MSAPYPTQFMHQRPSFGPALKSQARHALSALHDVAKKEQIIDELRNAGVRKFSHTRAEGRELYKILHDDEHIMGIAYGNYARGFALLVATNKRVLFIDKKFMFIEVDEVSYVLIGGVSHVQSGLFNTVVLHTRIGNYKLRTMNMDSTQRFIDYIESRCLEYTEKSGAQ